LVLDLDQSLVSLYYIKQAKVIFKYF